MIRKFFVLLTCLAVSIVINNSSVLAGVVYNEAVDGDLSNNNLNPTSLGLFTDQNLISGTTGNVRNSGEADVFTFSVGAGMELNSIFLNRYVSTDNVAFIAINDDVTFPYDFAGLDAVAGGSADKNAFLGGSTFTRNNVGQNIMPTMGLITGRGFTGSLGPGDYTIYIQQTGASTDYTFQFNVSAVPEPSSMILFGLAVAGFASRRRRRL